MDLLPSWSSRNVSQRATAYRLVLSDKAPADIRCKNHFDQTLEIR